jgi:hypothetical protein
MAALSQEAELKRACPSVLICSQFGHEQPFGQTSICSECACFVKIIASIEDPAVIKQILAHLDQRVASSEVASLPQCRAPPQIGLFEETHHSNARLY